MTEVISQNHGVTMITDTDTHTHTCMHFYKREKFISKINNSTNNSINLM